MEDIKVLESFIKQLEEYEDEQELKQAIENLIKKYKELEEHMQKFYTAELFTAKQVKLIEEDYIPKSKVREKIEKLQNEIKENRSIASRTADRVEARILNDQINELYKAIKILEELLQEGDK